MSTSLLPQLRASDRPKLPQTQSFPSAQSLPRNATPTSPQLSQAGFSQIGFQAISKELPPEVAQQSPTGKLESWIASVEINRVRIEILN
jgi:hypothetical protein